nr:endolytic transglycosylase MltG [Ardenticatena sp.]
MSNEERLTHIRQRLQEIQQQLATLAKAAAELRHSTNTNDQHLREIEAQIATLRRERDALQDEELALRRAARGRRTPPTTPMPATPSPHTPQKRRSLVRAILGMGLVVGAVVVLGAVLLLVFTQILVPPPSTVEGVLTEEELAAAENQPQSLEQRLVGLYLALNRDKITQRPSNDDSTVVFTIEPGETALTIAQRLEDEGLVTDATLFRRLLVYRGADQKLAAGTYQLRRNMTMDELIQALQQGRVEEVVVTIPEGWRREQIAEFLDAKELVPAAEYLAATASVEPYRTMFDFLADAPPDAPLEGFLFPDTYRVIPDETTAHSFVEMQLRTFGERLSPELRAAIAEKGLTIYEAVTLASIVEREAVVDEERPLIASVFENRWRDGTLLNADPTVQYALGYQEETQTWWKTPLYLDDLEIDSPYNTYKYPGLPPTPICNPGLAALRAVATAPSTNYYYFVARGDGTHVFAETLEEHQQNVERYRR